MKKSFEIQADKAKATSEQIKKKENDARGAKWYEESKNIERIYCMCIVDTVLEPRAKCVHEEKQTSKYKQTKQKLQV